MSVAILLTSLVVLGGPVRPDTTVTLRRGDRVQVRDLGGELEVRAWDRAEMEVTSEDRSAGNVTVSRNGSRVLLEPEGRKGRREDVVMTIRLPSWAALDVQGRELDVDISGTAGDVSVRNVSGDIRVQKTTGDLDLSSVEGEVTVTDARGSVRAHSRGDDVTLTRIVGDVDAGTGDGNVRLDGIDAASVSGETLDGDVYFAGSLMAGGRYSFSVHDGDATLVIPRASEAHVTVSTFDGEFSSDFPVTLQHYTGQGRFGFTLGKGNGAQVSVEVFDGEIRLRRGNGREGGE
ncbi:MAG: DUF4097 domain-containing protein [Gemmatimonadetes bacterium]|nr:DUF4097 domain-containing protein [Gemmatimonadota bacterium]